MQGSFLADTSLIEGLTIQQALRYTCSLRLAIMYDAPRDVQEGIISAGQPFANLAAMLTYGTEWRFLLALHCLRFMPEDPRIQEARDHLCTMPDSEQSLPFGAYKSTDDRRQGLCEMCRDHRLPKGARGRCL